MILIDYNGIALASIMTQNVNDLDEDLIRHVILNNVRHAVSKFSDKYGKVAICCDSSNNWRKTIFPYYKAGRKASRDSSDIDWGKLYSILDNIRNELNDYFPYYVLKIDTLEADDIIAVLALNCEENNIIISNDKDFLQLKARSNVDIYSPLKSSMLKCLKPEEFLQEHIIRGDRSDGVPNILSDDDTFVTGKRQKSIRSTSLVNWISSKPENVFDEETLARYYRNKAMISLMDLPKEVTDKVMTEFTSLEYKSKPGATILSYFIKNNLRNMIDKITDFQANV